jgi:tetratricopeptide (TPR) repeat protein
MLNKLLSHPLSAPLLILILGTLAYANSFQVPFVLDDLESITGNQSIRELGNFLPGGSGYEFQFRRSLVYFSFALNYYFGGLSVFGYHLFNLAVHLGSGLLVYLLLRQSFRTPVLSRSRLAPAAPAIALLAALFFVLHPIQTQAITYVVQRLASLCSFFYLLAMVLYLQVRLRMEADAGENTDNPAGRGVPTGRATHRVAPTLLFASVASAVAAMFCKEIAVTLPVAALLYELCFFRGAWGRRILLLLPLLLTLAIVPLLTFNQAPSAQESLQAQTFTETAPSHYLFTQFRVIVTYLRLLILPVSQNLDYDYPLYSTFFTPPVLLSFLLLAGMVALALALFRATRASAHGPQAPDPALRLIGFGILWFFLTLSVESSIVPLADLIFEHRLYLPSVGLAAALAVAVMLASQRTASWFGGRVPIAAAVAAIVVLSLATWQRNQVWQSELNLWQDVAVKSPNKVRPLYNYGYYLTETGQPQEAVQVLNKVVGLDPKHADAWHNLGRSYLLLGRTAEAVPALRTAVRLEAKTEFAKLNLATALIQSKQYAEAIELLGKVLREAPERADIQYNLGVAYLGAGDIPAAKRVVEVLYRLRSEFATPLAAEIGRISK